MRSSSARDPSCRLNTQLVSSPVLAGVTVAATVPPKTPPAVAALSHGHTSAAPARDDSASRRTNDRLRPVPRISSSPLDRRGQYFALQDFAPFLNDIQPVDFEIL